MKFTSTPDALLPILKKLGLAVNPKSVLPILENIFVIINKKEVVLTTTDLGLTITATVPADTHGKNGAFLLPFKQLKRLVELEEQPLHIEYTPEGEVMLSFGNDPAKPTSRFCLGTPGQVTDFPQLPIIDTEPAQLSPDFMQAINMAALSVSKDELRPAMCCVCVELTTTETHIVSTDAHSLYHQRLPTGMPTLDGPVELLLPAALAHAIAGLPAAHISFNKTHIAILSEGLTICCGRGDTKYVAWRTVMPVHNTNITLDAQALQLALEKTLVVADITTCGVDLKPSPFDIEISAIDTETGMTAKSVLHAVTTELKPTHLRTNGRLLIRALKQIAGASPDFSTQNLCLSMQQSTKPITLRPDNRDDITILVMPMNIN